ncbi:MAG: mannose-1-phosphate guanylyltransferase/mannose-6-phosphate isomerase [Rickettsiales bacterium]|nr:mannose-1-phosphate guanylyltransferase/mannose-6-phosphate isomerase [Rickettsiales bacterium]
MPTKQNATIVPVILSGGMGTRLWPMSRSHYPKQFLKLASEDYTLIQQTMLRVADRDVFEAPVFVSNEDHRFLVAENVQELEIDDAEILLEPKGRNTAPALTIAAHYIRKAHGDDAVMLVLPSDHIIDDVTAFREAVMKAAQSAVKGNLTTFGITPSHADTGYGYIKFSDKEISEGTHPVSAFVEKPDAKTAEKYLASGEYTWNSGMFAFPVALLLEEMLEHRSDIAQATAKAFNTIREGEDFIHFDAKAFASIPAESIDYAVMEPTTKAAVVPVDCGWTDAGSFDALWRVKDKDKAGNVSEGENTFLDSKDCYVNSTDGVKVSVLGVKDLIVISTKDCVMVADRNNAQDVKKLVDKLKVEDPKLVDEYRQMARPWGNYDSIDHGDRHQVKRITVKPGASLSLQMHYHRAEHWIVVKGTAIVTRDDTRKVVSENESVYIPCGAKHRLVNPGSIPLELIEVQSGSYLGEDDIVRFEDTYGRMTEVV